jgi:hypothetical protein
LAKYLRKEGFSKSRNKIFLRNHSRERKDEVRRFESQMVALGSSEYIFRREQMKRERERERERQG